MENKIIELKPFIKMGAEKLREELYLLIGKVDEEYLKAIHTLLIRNLQKDETVLEDIPMNPKYEGMTAEDIEMKLKESRKQYEKGEVYTTEEVRAMIKGRK